MIIPNVRAKHIQYKITYSSFPTPPATWPKAKQTLKAIAKDRLITKALFDPWKVQKEKKLSKKMIFMWLDLRKVDGTEIEWKMCGKLS